MATVREQSIRWFVLLSNLLVVAPFIYLIYKIIRDKDYNKIANAILTLFTSIVWFLYHLCQTDDSPGDDGYFHVCILPFSNLSWTYFVVSIVTIANLLSYSPPTKHYWVRDVSIMLLLLLSPYVFYQSSNQTAADTNMYIFAGSIAAFILISRLILRRLREDALNWYSPELSNYCWHAAIFPTPPPVSPIPARTPSPFIYTGPSPIMKWPVDFNYPSTDNDSPLPPRAPSPFVFANNPIETTDLESDYVSADGLDTTSNADTDLGEDEGEDGDGDGNGKEDMDTDKDKNKDMYTDTDKDKDKDKDRTRGGSNDSNVILVFEKDKPNLFRQKIHENSQKLKKQNEHQSDTHGTSKDQEPDDEMDEKVKCKCMRICCSRRCTYYELSWKIPESVIWWFPWEGNLVFLITALLLSAAGLVCFIENNNNLNMYWYLHPAWHSFEALATLFWFLFIDTIPDEHISFNPVNYNIRQIRTPNPAFTDQNNYGDQSSPNPFLTLVPV